jgi:hypothetical protein
MATTSGSYTYSTNRDAIITRALRIIGAIGQGETPSATAITEGAEALNDVVKEWEADGMPLWALTTYKVRPTSGVATYTLSDGPLRIIHGWTHDSSSDSDTDLVLLTRQEYQGLGSKLSSGPPSQFWYDPPGNLTKPGMITFFPVPDSTCQTYHTYSFTGQKPFEDFDTASDVPDFPQYWFNAVKWGLADQLAYEYGVGITERSMISKKALFHKSQALSFGGEEGSLRIHPDMSQS